MVNNTPITEEELQEKALYDLVQYLPLDDLNLYKGHNINYIVEQAIKADDLSEEAQQAIEDNLPTIKAILKDRPELGEAKITNMSWQDNDHDGKPDHPVLGMQACTFEREDQVYISFRGTPKRAWLDNGKAFTPDNVEAEERYDEKMYNQLLESEGQRTARYYLEYRENEKCKRNL